MGQYLPLVVLGLLAVLFAGISLTMSRLLSRKRPNAAKPAPYECGIVPSKEPPRALPGELLPRGDAVHHVRHRDRLPVPVRGVARRRSAPTASGRSWSSASCSSSSFVYVVAKGVLDWGPVRPGPAAHGDMVSAERTTRTTIRRVGLEGRTRSRARRPRRERAGRGVPGVGRDVRRRRPRRARPQLPDGQARGPRAMGPLPLQLGRQLRAGVLRHRDDGRGRRALRPGPLRHGGLPGLAPPGRHHDRGRPGQPEDGARCCARSTTR